MCSRSITAATGHRRGRLRSPGCNSTSTRRCAACSPYRHSQALFELAEDPKELWIVPGVGHTRALANDAVRRRLVEYLVRHAGS
jgi:hypothetical protein